MVLGHLDGQKDNSDKYSLRGRVFHQIREDILSGKYKENEELKETAIGLGMGVSRTPVREALRQLELEGLVNIIPNKGAYVTGITPDDVRDIYMIRSRLEGLSARLAAANISEEGLVQLEEILYLSDFHARKEHFDQVFELDGKFHEGLYEASGSKMLGHLLSDFHLYVKKVRRKTISTKDRAKESNKEHMGILEALREHNPDKAEKLATIHIMKTIENIGNYRIENILD
jgi:DNA-binding GntR family transcriptional regulator